MTTNEKKSKLVPKLDLNFTDYAIDTFIPTLTKLEPDVWSKTKKIMVLKRLHGKV